MECCVLVQLHYAHRPFTRTWTRKSTWPSWLAIQLRAAAATRRDFGPDCTRLCVPCEVSRRAPPSAVNIAAPVEAWRKRRPTVRHPSGPSRGRGRHATTRTHAWRRESAARTAIRVATGTLSSPFSTRATGACLVCPWNVNFSYLNRGQCCRQEVSCPRQMREKRNGQKVPPFNIFLINFLPNIRFGISNFSALPCCTITCAKSGCKGK